MDVIDLCDATKRRVALELKEALDPARRSELLIGALYQASESILPRLGVPRTSRRYLEEQGAVLNLVSFLVLPLIREELPDRRAVAVLSEIAEGCLDPLLRKKLSVYAQELLAKSGRAREGEAPKGPRRSHLLFGALAAACFSLFLAAQAARQLSPGEAPPSRADPAAETPPSQPADPQQHAAYASPPAPQPSTVRPGEPVDDREGGEGSAAQRGAPLRQGKGVTAVRVVNNQVLVPVTLKNGGNTVTLQLLLDTGATRTAIYEGVASRLGIDPREARSSFAVVADGRTIQSRVARIESLSVGPFAMASVELELIPYHGSDGTFDGLLGMDFLGKRRYQIDVERELIRWF